MKKREQRSICHPGLRVTRPAVYSLRADRDVTSCLHDALGAYRWRARDALHCLTWPASECRAAHYGCHLHWPARNQECEPLSAARTTQILCMTILLFLSCDLYFIIHEQWAAISGREQRLWEAHNSSELLGPARGSWNSELGIGATQCSWVIELGIRNWSHSMLP